MEIKDQEIKKKKSIIYTICSKCKCVTPHSPRCMNCLRKELKENNMLF